MSGCSAWVLDNLKKKEAFLKESQCLAAVLVTCVIAWLCVLEEMSRWWKDSKRQATMHSIQVARVLSGLIANVRKPLVNIVYSPS